MSSQAPSTFPSSLSPRPVLLQWGLERRRSSVCAGRVMCPSGMDWILGGGPVCARARVCICEHAPRYTGRSEQVKGFRSMLEKQQLNCCLARKGVGGAGWGWGTGLVAGPGTCGGRSRCTHAALDGRAGTHRGNLQGGRLSSAPAQPWNGQSWEAASNPSGAKPARTDRHGIPLLERHFVTNDFRGQDFLYLWVSQ